jgi:hypothetical protein
MLKETWEKCILPEGSYGGQPVGPDDVMELQRGGTGFAGHDKELQVGRLGDVGGWRAGGGRGPGTAS